jgi:hypothetical protein
MLLDSASISVPANGFVNAFIGRPIEFIGTPSVARLLATADTQGLTLTWTINVGGVQHVPIAAGASVNAIGPGTAVGGGPKEDEDTMATNVPLPAGSRNALTVTNTTAAAVNFRYRAVILP